jgi:hemicentin
MNEKILAIEIDQLTLSYLKRVLRENNSVEFSCFFKSWMHCDLALADKGIYNCHAENEVGEDEKTTVVDVVEPHTVISQPEVKTPQEGATLELECNARGNPPPEITWFRDGKKVVADDEVYITDNGLVILSATRKMSGIWKCVAKNVANEIVLEHVINVEWPPSIVFPELPTSKSVKLGSQVILECPVDASPAPEFEWSVNGNIVDFNAPGWLLDRETGTLVIEKASLALQDARFQCYAANIHGNSVISVGLKINIPPSIIPRTWPIINAKIGSKVIIPCAASGIPEPELIWTSNNGKFGTQGKLLDQFKSNCITWYK